ncbi:MAG TPA: hypothetical protein VGJ71_04800 [Candidatus Limnocylindrales bacterium]
MSARVPADPKRDPDLALARVHLLLGSLSLARTELETLAGRGELDDDGIRDLAEARWRTGDMGGAGEAAAAWLEGHADDVLGLVIAAEAQAALGRPAEARRLAGRALERANGSLDPVFAGMQRSPIWPVEPGGVAGAAGVLFDDLHPGPHAVPPLPRSHPLAFASAPTVPADSDAAVASHAVGPSLWGEEVEVGSEALADAPDPTLLFHGARVALDRGDAADAATGLILALRAAPGLAPAILDLLSGRGEPILALVRGDAERIVGREVEAMRDHATAAGGLLPAADSPPSTSASGSDPDPGPDREPEPEPSSTHPDQEDS